MRGGQRSRSARWAAAACLLGLGLAPALGLAACGGGSPAATAQADAPAVKAKSPSTSPTAGGACAGQVGGFIDSMGGLRTKLVAGLSYEQYVGEVEAIRGAYRRIPVGKLTLGCLKAAGTPAESALNTYIEASNTWTDCVEAGCEAATVEPALQSKWRQASKLLTEAQRGLQETRR